METVKNHFSYRTLYLSDNIKPAIKYSTFVIPAKAGIQRDYWMSARTRRFSAWAGAKLTVAFSVILNVSLAAHHARCRAYSSFSLESLVAESTLKKSASEGGSGSGAKGQSLLGA